MLIQFLKIVLKNMFNNEYKRFIEIVRKVNNININLKFKLRGIFQEKLLFI